MFNIYVYFAIKKGKNGFPKFHGAFLDTVTQRTVILIIQGMEYSHFINEKFKHVKNYNRYRFGKYRQKSRGSIPIRVPITNLYVLSVIFDVVSPDVPFLLGVYFL